MIVIKVILGLFLFFAASRVILRFKSGEVSFFGLVFWTAVFLTGIILTFFPNLAGIFASFLGIGRGVDAVIYLSIAVLFYLVFRLYVYLVNMKSEITKLVREIALKNEKDKNKTS